MNASGRTLFLLKPSLLGTSLLFTLAAIPVGLTAQNPATPVTLPAQKTNRSLSSTKPIIPGPPILHHGIVQGAGNGASALADADDVRQDPADPSHAHNATTGQDLAWDADKKSWIEAKSGQSLGFNGMQVGDGTIIPAPPILHHGLVTPAADGVNPRADADDVHQYESDPDHAYDRTTHQSLYWDAKKQAWVDINSGHALGFDGAPIASPVPAPVPSKPQPPTPPASVPTGAAQAPAAAQPVASAAAQAPTSAPAPTESEEKGVGMRPDYSSNFTLGWAAGVSWTKPTGALAGANPQTVMSISIPSPQYLIQWNAARRVSLGLYLGGSYVKQGSISSGYGTSTPGASSTSLNFGLEPDIYFLGHNRARDIRLFIGPGLWYNYADVSGSTTPSAAHQFAASGILGAELPIWREGRLRAGIEYGHDFQNTQDNLAAANYYAFDLGLMFDTPDGLADDYADYENAYLPRFSIRYGSELGFTSFGAMGGTTTPSEYSVALPTETVGGYVGIGSTRQLRIGTELDFTRLSTTAASSAYVGLEPGLEYYLLRHPYKGWDFRVRGFGIAEWEGTDVSVMGYNTSTQAWLSGYGAEGMFTHHFFGPQLIGIGVSYAHVGDSMTLDQPAQNSINLKFTIDSRL